MPFGEYKNFDECVSKNQDKENHEAYCGEIKKQLEGKSIKSLNAALLKMKVSSLRVPKKAQLPDIDLMLDEDDAPDIEKHKKELINKKLSKEASCSCKLGKYLSASMEEEFDDGKYVSYFLLKGDEVNGRGWGVDADSIPENIMTFKGKPLVVTSSDFFPKSPYGKIFDHPSTEHFPQLGIAKMGEFDPNDLDLITKFQNKFRIGVIRDVFEKDGIWRAIASIDEPFRNKPMPPFVSPAIFKLDPHEEDGSLTKWTGLHLAALDSRPAYGKIAILKAQCSGQFGKCEHQLKSAKGPDFIREFNHHVSLLNLKYATIAGKFASLKIAALTSESLSDTQRQNLVNCTKRDELGNCLSTDAKKRKI